MSYLLDTNTCIRYLNGQSESIRHRLAAASPHEVDLCSIVKAELLYGSLKSANPERNLRRLEQFFAPFVSLPFDDPAARAYGDIRALLERSGRLIGPNDLLIAAIALARGATLVTHNVREFSRIPALQHEDWELP